MIVRRLYRQDAEKRQEERNNRELDRMQMVSETETRATRERLEAVAESQRMNSAILRTDYANTSLILGPHEKQNLDGQAHKAVVASITGQRSPRALRMLLQVILAGKATCIAENDSCRTCES